MIIRFAFKTDTGRARDHNEDNFFVMPDLSDPSWEYTTEPTTVGPMGSVFAIADGMGGASAGEVASLEAISAVEKSFKEVRMPLSDYDQEFHGLIMDVFQKAQSRIIEVCRADSSVSGMGTTLLLGWIRKGKLHMAWLGDSRGYLARKDGTLYHITKDHSYVQELLDSGKIDKNQAFYHPDSNVITKSLGDFSGRYHNPEIAVYDLEPGDRILLCSDGLNSMLMDEEIADILFSERDVRVCADRCIDAANERGGHDNITVIVLDIEETDKGQLSLPKRGNTMRLAHEASKRLGKIGSNPRYTTMGGNGRGAGFLGESWLMYTLISLTLLSVGFLAGRLTMKSEFEMYTRPPIGKGAAEKDLYREPVESETAPIIKTIDSRQVPKEDTDPENMDYDGKQKEIRIKEELKKANKSDTLRRRVKDSGQKVLTPIETN
jgi:serine/threonine protein phosphatase PrpC